MCRLFQFAAAAGVCQRCTVSLRHAWLAILFVVAVGPHSVPAANGTWSSSASSGTWSTTTNWLSGIVPGATLGTTNTDTATFNSSSSTTLISPDSNRNLENITFDTSAAQYTVGLAIGNGLLLTSGGQIQIAGTFTGVGVSEGVGAPLKLEGSYTFADNTSINGDLLSFGGAITSGTAGTQTLTVSGVGNTAINGAIGGGTGTIALTKNGAGTLTLGGNNTFTGGVTINAGIVTVSSSGALNSATPNAVVFGVGSFPELDLGVSVTVSGLATTGSTTVPFVRGEGTSTTTLTVNNSVTNNFAGRLFDDTSPLALVKGGVGTLILSDNNNFSGGVTINAGTLQLNAPAALFGPTLNVVTFGAGSTGTLDLNGSSATIGGLNTNSLVGTPVVTNSSSAPRTLEVQVASGNSTYAGVLQDGPTSGSLLLLKTGSGTLTLSGANTFTAPVNINAGTLAMNGGSLAADVHNQATFNYYGGTFAGRLFNTGAVNFFSDFTAGNGMENDGNLSITSGQPVTLDGVGLDNEGTLSMSGVALNLSTTGANVNRGSINLSTVLSLAGGAALTNSGSIALNGGVVSDASGTLTNTFGGTVSGVGTIQCVFANSGGLVSVGGGTLNITQPFTNSGIVQLTAFTANLGGGAINNTGEIQGFGNVGNAVTNTGTIEPIGGTLFLSGTLLNPSGGLIRAGAGNKLLVVHGLLASAGIVNLTGGTFDNNNQPINNLGQISGFGVFASGGTGLDNNGSITFSGGLTTVNGPVTNEGGHTITVAQNNAIFTGLVTNKASATFNAVNATATFAGGFVNNGNSNFVKAGGGTVEIDNAPTLNNGSTLSVTTGTLRFNVVSGTPTIGTGVTAVVSAGATLELAGSVSALANGASRVNIINSSTASGILVSGTHQQVGNIDGSGTTQVNAGSDLTANHIVQSALVIGGTAKNPGSVTIDASDASGNPLAASWGFALAGSLTPSAPFVAGALTSSKLLARGGSPASGSTLGGGNLGSGTFGDSAASVPEPTTLLLALLGLVSLGGLAWRKRK
jgi:fibronectin-binding autotransporter adhesin